jgi:hypothetical protein
MSLLSSTQGRPDRVRSLLRVLEAYDGSCVRADLERWMLPTAFQTSGSKTAFTQTVDAARSLKLIASSTDPVTQTGKVPLDLDGFADYVHDVLAMAPSKSDEVMMDAFAYFVIACEQERGTAWIKKLTAPTLAGRVDAALRHGVEGDDRLFNDTKYPAWRSWMIYLGLALEADKLPSFYPYPVLRLERELGAIGERLGTGSEVPAAEFLASLAARMPYLDGGAIFKKMAEKMAWRPTENRLTMVLSQALRELHDDQRLVLHQLGDNRGDVHLFRDPTHGIDRFYAVSIAPRRTA